MVEKLKTNLRADIPASLVVFLVALPLCLGIAVASGAPPISGLIAGMIGGIVVGSFSGSNISVSGPAAGLTSIVLSSISTLGSFEIFLGTVVVAGFIQFILGAAKAGMIGYYFPTSVIKGMLAAIGLILILKQIPHALGFDADFEGDQSFYQPDTENTFTEILKAVFSPNLGAIIISSVVLAIIILWESSFIKRIKSLSLIPGALVAVVSAILLNNIFSSTMPNWHLSGNHLVQIPISTSFSDLSSLLTFPDFTAFTNKTFWITACTIAVVASIETLLSIEAADKIDPYKRVSPASKELRAQGIGNIVSGMLGGLPITAVIVRSSANVAAGAKSKNSAIFHGFLLLLLVLTIPKFLNLIPLSCLASVLFFVGYKLTKPALYVTTFKKGIDQFLPFIAKIIAILFTDLLIGIGIGMAFGIFFVIRTNFQSSLSITEHNGNYLLKFKKDVSFLNKAPLLDCLAKIPSNSKMIVQGHNAKFIDQDIKETLQDFITSTAHKKNIKVTLEDIELY